MSNNVVILLVSFIVFCLELLVAVIGTVRVGPWFMILSYVGAGAWFVFGLWWVSRMCRGLEG